MEGAISGIVAGTAIAQREWPAAAQRARSVPLVRLRAVTQRHARHGTYPLKRTLDITITLLALVPIGFIILGVIALAIRLDSAGPVLYRQKRLGQGGMPFEMLKFRSMHHNCDQEMHRQAITRFMSGQRLSTREDSCLAFKLDHDPRITRVGRFIRKSSLDELPQLFNVLAGQMSLVGPRPPLPYEAELYRPRDWRRMEGIPGLTGIWQVYGRSRVTFETMIAMDLEYLRRQGIWLDLKLIFLTIPTALSGRGAA
jgi:lipopolysaccharide/colanic/teichoic acid biosynthesis glycosyltransferase